MIKRYTRPEMGRIWDDENRFRIWLQIEILACEALADLGVIPIKAMDAIKERAGFEIGRIDEIEKDVKHDVIAFLTSVAEHVGDEARYIHLGLTSSDILDTCLAVQLTQASDILIRDCSDLLNALKEKAFQYRSAVMIGRSHGVHAEPTTFGLKMALWYAEMERNLERMEKAKEAIKVGKISGAVGTFANCPPQIEKYVCDKLGLKPDPISTQIVQRDRHAEFFTTLAVIASSIEKFATEVRHLQRTEVLEVEECFSQKQKGSSAMPHKRNPVASEQMCGLARLIRSNAQAALENVALWHERDISHSSVERIICPDTTILLDHMLARFTKLMANLIVYPERMKENLEKTGGLIYSQRVLLEMVKRGISRDDAYRIIQRNAMKTWQSKSDFKRLLENDPAVKPVMTKGDLENSFSLHYHLQHVNTIFQRVFGESVPCACHHDAKAEASANIPSGSHES
ncbi:adenylosuccinate lyase [bacterium]|nr:adenylosuccinate lyase [bacterium]